MNNPKIEKVKTEIEKAKAKILEAQAKLRALERQKTELENEQIVAIVRSERISDAELSALLQSFQKKETKPASSKAIVSESNQEEPGHENSNEQ